MRFSGGIAALMLMLWLPCAAWADPARIVIVIDDLGFQPARDQAILALDIRLTAAIIPEAPSARHLARRASLEKRDVLVHLPLPGLNHDNCQPVLTCIHQHWSAHEVDQALLTALEQVEGAIGLNNHQGSRFTTDPEAVDRLVRSIRQISEERDQPLLVLDSRTVPGSVLEYKARKAGLPAGRRHVFLDHSDRPEDIEQAWQTLIELARQRGSAVAIAHPRPNTIAFLSRALPELEARGIELVPISTLSLQPEDSKRAGSEASSVSAAP